MRKVVDILKSIFRWIWIIILILLILFIGFIWWRDDDGKPLVKLSIFHVENNKTEKFMRGLSGIDRELDSFASVLNYEKRLQLNYDVNISLLQNELLELDKNETTYENVIFEGDLNSSLKTFHRFWVIQSLKDNENSSKLLFYDANTTFPIHIYEKKSQKWATIKTEVLDNRTKEWVYKKEKYEEK